MLTAVSESPHFSVACAEGGLFIEIVRECRGAYGGDIRLSVLCGRDAAERAADWNYGTPDAFPAMLREFHLLVASRGGEYAVPPGFTHAIQRLELEGEFDHVSASEVRQRIASGGAWEHLVPQAVRDGVRRLYR